MLLLLSLIAGPAMAQAARQAPSLPAWEQLSSAQRELLIGPTRERWNANPEARARMFEHAQRWRQLTPGQRTNAHHGLGRWEKMDPQQRQTMRALFQKMRDLPPERRRALRERWRAMTPEQRRAWVGENSPSGN
jgi:hypothetical protein